MYVVLWLSLLQSHSIPQANIFWVSYLQYVFLKATYHAKSDAE